MECVGLSSSGRVSVLLLSVTVENGVSSVLEGTDDCMGLSPSGRICVLLFLVAVESCVGSVREGPDEGGVSDVGLMEDVVVVTVSCVCGISGCGLRCRRAFAA